MEICKTALPSWLILLLKIEVYLIKERCMLMCNELITTFKLDDI